MFSFCGSPSHSAGKSDDMKSTLMKRDRLLDKKREPKYDKPLSGSLSFCVNL
jgi:hypothetical protein